MKKQLVLLVTALTMSAGAFAQSVTEIMDKHIAALGGTDKINAIKTIQYDQTMNVQGMELAAKTTVVVNQSSRSDVSAMGQNIVTVIDGDKGWMINPMTGNTAPQELPADQVKLSAGNTEVTGLQLATAKSKGYDVELIGKEKLNNADVYNLRVARPEGRVNYYVDANTYNVVATKAIVVTGGQTAEVNAKFADFKPVEGVVMPHTLEMMVPGAPSAITVKVTKIAVNPTVDKAIFAMPK